MEFIPDGMHWREVALIPIDTMQEVCRDFTPAEYAMCIFLMIAMWENGGTLELKQEALRRLSGASRSAWYRSREKVLSVFVRQGTTLTHAEMTPKCLEVQAEFERTVVRH